jgi:hypothetical protein
MHGSFIPGCRGCGLKIGLLLFREFSDIQIDKLFCGLFEFMDRGLSDWQAEIWAYVVPWSTNSTLEFRDIHIDNRTCRVFEFEGACVE